MNEMTTDSPPTMSDALPMGLHLGKYEIRQVLGQGGFGFTYLALDRENGDNVVIKENLPAQFSGRGGDSLTVTTRGGRDGADNFEWAKQRFLEEARLLAYLNHPNIVRVLLAFSALGTAYYVMPWVGGRDLKHYAEEHGMDQPFLEGVLRQLLPALSYLHGNNLLHRDIKPANILCAAGGTPILIDFGTARALVSERSQTMVESAGYTPLEQIQSHGNTGPWTDLYALGATLYTLVTGEHPPRSTDRIGKTDCYVPLVGRAELKGRYDAGFLAGIDKALALWPEDRWQSADEWLRVMQGKVRPPAVPANAPASWNLISATVACFRRTFNYKDRASRSEFWFFALARTILLLSAFACAIIYEASGEEEYISVLFCLVFEVAYLALLPAAVSVLVRRLHDIGWNGYYMLPTLLPLIGEPVLVSLGCIAFLVIIGFCCGRSDPPNRFGAAPLPPT